MNAVNADPDVYMFQNNGIETTDNTVHVHIVLELDLVWFLVALQAQHGERNWERGTCQTSQA